MLTVGSAWDGGVQAGLIRKDVTVYGYLRDLGCQQMTPTDWPQVLRYVIDSFMNSFSLSGNHYTAVSCAQRRMNQQQATSSRLIRVLTTFAKNTSSGLNWDSWKEHHRRGYINLSLALPLMHDWEKASRWRHTCYNFHHIISSPSVRNSLQQVDCPDESHYGLSLNDGRWNLGDVENLRTTVRG